MDNSKTWEETHREIGDMFQWHSERRVELLRRQTPITSPVKQYYFLTINPPPHITLKDFLKAVYKSVSKKWLSVGLFVIEQRGETQQEAGRGFHTHILFNKGQKHSIIVREMKNSFKHIVDIENTHFFNLKNIDTEEYKRKEEYILYEKADPEKHLKQEIDILFRQVNNLKSHYIIGHDTKNG